MGRRVYLVLGATFVITVAGGSIYIERTNAIRREQQARVAAVYNYIAQLAASPRGDPGVMIPHPPAEMPGPNFQLCELSSQSHSCMALDPRPFTLCPAVDSGVCNAEGKWELLSSNDRRK